MKISIINGPNLNLLGQRNPEIYGAETWEETERKLRAEFTGVEIRAYQSNSEGEIIDMIQKLGYDAECMGIVINPGAYSHYSYAIADALAAIPAEAVEVHISNIMAREEHRHKSATGAQCSAIIAGAGRYGYSLAIRLLIHHSADRR